MTKRPTNLQDPDGPLWTGQAAEWLHEHIPGESASYWSWFLVNNRREDRNPPHRIPFIRERGAVLYRQRDLAEFVSFEKRRRLADQKFEGRAAEVMMAYGIGTPTGGAYGKKLDCQVNVQENETGPYLQMIVQNPLQVFYIPPTQVRQLAKAFAQAARQMPKVSR